MWDYTDKVREYFLNPRNVGEIEDADGVGEVGSMACGDMLKLTFKLDENGRIADAKFKTYGCASAIASSSVLTELIKGKTIEEAEKITNDDIVRELGGLPAQKLHCSVLGKEALDAAIAYYRNGGKKPEQEGTIVCTCFGVTDKEIEHLVREHNLTSVAEVTDYCKAGGGCGGCKSDIADIILNVTGKEATDREPPKRERPKLTTVQKIRLIEETIDREVRPALKQDGGDIELIDVDGNRVLVAFRGTCANCRVAEFTMKDVVEAKLKEFVDPGLVVEEAKP